MKEIIINDLDWYAENNIKLHLGDAVTKLDTANKRVVSASGVQAEYDALILATGSDPFMLPLPGAQKEGVIGFRDIKDCELMIEASKKYKKAAVIGGGLLGLEAARGLLNLGMDVSVVHINPFLMERQLDEPAARMLQRELEAQGMKFLLQKQTASIYGHRRAEGLEFADGSRLEADLVVMAVGIRPNVELAKSAGLEVKRGIIVNDDLETSAPGVYAVGECAEHRGIAYGLVAPLYEQGSVLAKRLAGVETAGYEGSVTSTKLKVSGVDVFSAGYFHDAPGTRSLRIQDELEGTYRKMSCRTTGSSARCCLGTRRTAPRCSPKSKAGSRWPEKKRSCCSAMRRGSLPGPPRTPGSPRWRTTRSFAAATAYPKERSSTR
ncbi:hypothetical protein HMSSN036_75550 [Paenibacillus macerans]|nr:hypothetical protein HMSSN036_75550 [Paenibacillus macerans]